MPCANCVRRECPDVCPNQTLGNVKSLRRRVSRLDQPRNATSSPSSYRESGTTLATHIPPPTTNPGIDSGASDVHSVEDQPERTPKGGTLVINPDGRCKFIGQSASYEWLRDVSIDFSTRISDNRCELWTQGGELTSTGNKCKSRNASTNTYRPTVSPWLSISPTTAIGFCFSLVTTSPRE